MTARRARRRLAAVAIFAVLGALMLAAAPASAAQKPPQIDARAWLLLDAKDGERLAKHASRRELEIASTTKLMTAYLALERLPLNRRLPAAPYSPISPAESLLGLEAGERITVRDLLYALLLPSANDAAVTLAEGVAGSERKFVGEMNETARDLGLLGTHYQNPIGLDAAANRSTADDLARLTQELRKRPTFRRIVATPRITLRTGAHPRTITSRNLLVLRYPWINGVKTGHTLQAGYVLVATGTQKGVTLLSVVLGAPSEAARDTDTLELMRYGFSQYRQKKELAKGEVVAKPDVRYQGESLDVVAARDLLAPVRRGQRVTTKIDAPNEVEGPVRRGERMGAATAFVDGRPVAKVPVLAADRVEAATSVDKVRSTALGPGVFILIGVVVILIGVLGIRRRRGENQRTAEERMRHQQERMRRRGERSP